MSDPASSGKTPSRFWLYAPVCALFAGALVLSLVWLVVRTRTLTEIEAKAATMRAQGFRVSWTDLRTSGFPFRVRLTADNLLIESPAGFSVRSDGVEAMALSYAPDRWTIRWRGPLTLGRPGGGAVRIDAADGSASLSEMDKPVWRMALDLQGVRFTTPAGAAPFALSSAKRLAAETRLSPTNPDDAEALVRWEDASPSSQGSLRMLGPDKHYSGGLALRVTSYVEFQGVGWSMAGRRWVREGGEFEIDPVDGPASALGLGTPGSTFLFDKEGHAKGELQLDLKAREDKSFQTVLLTLDEAGVTLKGERIAPQLKFF